MKLGKMNKYGKKYIYIEKEKKNDSRYIPKLENPIPSINIIPDPSLPKDNLYFTCDGHLTLSLRKCTLA